MFRAFPVMQVFCTITQGFFDTRKTLSLKDLTATPLKTCLKDNGNKYLVVIKYKRFIFE